MVCMLVPFLFLMVPLVVFVCCPWLILHSLLILAALRVPMAVTWLTVYRQLQIDTELNETCDVIQSISSRFLHYQEIIQNYISNGPQK